MNHQDFKQLRERLFQVALQRVKEDHPELSRAARRELAAEQVRQIAQSVKESSNETGSQPAFEA
jgi:hypothetical protein